MISLDSPHNEITRQVLLENRPYILDSLVDGDVLSLADYIFEQGFLTRQDYNVMEAMVSKRAQVAQFVDILIHKDNRALDAMITYLEKEGESSALVFRLKNARAKITSQNILEERSVKVVSPNSTTSSSSSSSSSLNQTFKLIDPSDFTLTEDGAAVVQKVVKTRRRFLFPERWAAVVESMNSLDASDQAHLNNLCQEEGNWDDVIANTLQRWMMKNGKNATFFSLVGVFQQVHLNDIADLLLEHKDEIYNSSKQSLQRLKLHWKHGGNAYFPNTVHSFDVQYI